MLIDCKMVEFEQPAVCKQGSKVSSAISIFLPKVSKKLPKTAVGLVFWEMVGKTILINIYVQLP